ncbi:spexin prohormone 2 isoform 2-T2 [Menidia menidia]
MSQVGMNVSVTELGPTGHTRSPDHGEPSSGHPWSEAGGQVRAGPPSEVSLSGSLHPHQHGLPADMFDPASLRFPCSCQPTQCQLTYPDYLMDLQSSQYHFLSGAVPDPSDCNHHRSASASWLTEEPVLTSVMTDLHKSVVMDHQQYQEGPVEVTSHITQPVVCNVTGDGPMVLVNPCDPGPMFLTMEGVQTQEESGLTTDGIILETPILGFLFESFPQYQTACSLYGCGGHTANVQPQAPPEGTVAAFCESRSRKPCHCTRSQCLKLYCECFANGVMCSSCNCSNCHNNAKHEPKRQEAIKSCLGRNPDAFRPKIAGGRSGVVKGWHNKGCNCKRSGCLKKYCECYEANIMCTSSCKCVGCRNYDDSSPPALKEKTGLIRDKFPASVITPAVLEAACGCLLAQAEEAEREAHAPAVAEQLVLDEFGHCLSQIVKTMFKTGPY